MDKVETPLDATPLAAQRLLNAYALALRQYGKAKRALLDASEPISAELVYAHHCAAENYRTITGIYLTSLTRSEALHAVERGGSDDGQA